VLVVCPCDAESDMVVLLVRVSPPCRVTLPRWARYSLNRAIGKRRRGRRTRRERRRSPRDRVPAARAPATHRLGAIARASAAPTGHHLCGWRIALRRAVPAPCDDPLAQAAPPCPFRRRDHSSLPLSSRYEARACSRRLRRRTSTERMISDSAHGFVMCLHRQSSEGAWPGRESNFFQPPDNRREIGRKLNPRAASSDFA
jgi:hypothetical protein